MSRYIYVLQGCNHKFTSKQEALDYASFDRWLEYMQGDRPSITIVSRYTPKQYKLYLQRKEKLNATPSTA